MERIWSNDEPDDHHLRLPGARSVVTGDALIIKENLAQVIKLQGMLCLYGEAGVGKTFLTRGVLRELAPVSTFWVRFRAHPYPRDIREALFESLGMAGPVPRRAGQFDRLILQQLRGEFRVLVCDEAQWLSAECFELWRFCGTTRIRRSSWCSSAAITATRRCAASRCWPRG
ncbi:ATP-binding protein [Nonomuraea sp. NPDC001831]|uniref:ATP-binding protein n=1 Tax=Nonomuraea sp. NPDC001831 TaxID=3364340 RepID=UPI0036859893